MEQIANLFIVGQHQSSYKPIDLYSGKELVNMLKEIKHYL